MPQIGPLEILVVMVVALLVFGPEKLPELARNVGRTANQLRRMAAEVREEISAGLEFDEDEDHSNARKTPEPRPDEAVPMDEADSRLPDDDDWERGELAEPRSRAEQQSLASEDSDADGKVARDTP